jgi:hypothetical protein
MCIIEGCSGKAVGKGLCAMHYMRARRTGDPIKTRRPGRKKDELTVLYENLFRDWSPRTRARFTATMRLLDESERTEAIKRATRASGLMSVSRLLMLAMTLDHLRRQCS